MNLAAWAQAVDTGVSRAKLLADMLPPSETGHGSAVPFPFLDRKGYQAGRTNKEINAAIHEAPKTIVPLEGLHAIQHSVKPEKLRYHLEHPRASGVFHPDAGTPVDLPVIIQANGIKYIHDGHHRLTVDKLRGMKSARVRLVDFDKE